MTHKYANTNAGAAVLPDFPFLKLRCLSFDKNPVLSVFMWNKLDINNEYTKILGLENKAQAILVKMSSKWDIRCSNTNLLVTFFFSFYSHPIFFPVTGCIYTSYH